MMHQQTSSSWNGLHPLDLNLSLTSEMAGATFRVAKICPSLAKAAYFSTAQQC
jgi:hypothetical protein